jgi:dephospho-CoA kinase
MIIGITGTLGSGKGMVAEYLTKKHNFTYYSVRNFFAQEVLRRGKMANRDTIAEVASELRAEHGETYALGQLMSQQALTGNNVVIESIRTKAEAEYLKAQGALLWAIDADLQIRYQRTLKRDASVEHVSLESFVEQEKKEVALKEVIASADVVLRNEGTKEEIFAQVEAALAKSGYNPKPL